MITKVIPIWSLILETSNKEQFLEVCQIPNEQVNLRPSNSQDRRTNGISRAILYWGFFGVLLVSSNASITCTVEQFMWVSFILKKTKVMTGDHFPKCQNLNIISLEDFEEFCYAHQWIQDLGRSWTAQQPCTWLGATRRHYL